MDTNQLKEQARKDFELIIGITSISETAEEHKKRVEKFIDSLIDRTVQTCNSGMKDFFKALGYFIAALLFVLSAVFLSSIINPSPQTRTICQVTNKII